MVSIAFGDCGPLLTSATLSLSLYDTSEIELGPDHQPFSVALCTRLILDGISLFPHISHLHINFTTLRPEPEGESYVEERLRLPWRSIAGAINQHRCIRSVCITLLAAFAGDQQPRWSLGMLTLIMPHFRTFHGQYGESRMQTLKFNMLTRPFGNVVIENTVFLYRSVNDAEQLFVLG